MLATLGLSYCSRRHHPPALAQVKRHAHAEQLRSGLLGCVHITPAAAKVQGNGFPFVGCRQAAVLVAGADHVAALTEAGGVLTWGTSGCGALGRVGPRLRDPKPTLLRPAPVLFKRAHGGGRVIIVDVACGTYCTFALADNRAVLAWGLNNYGQLALPGLVRTRLPRASIALQQVLSLADADMRVFLSHARHSPHVCWLCVGSAVSAWQPRA